MNNLAEPFVRRPVMTTLVMAAFLIFGIVGFRLDRKSTRLNSSHT